MVVEWFQHFNIANFSFFKKKNFAIFNFDIYVIIKVCQPNRKSPLGFDNKLLENVSWPWISFQLLLSPILAVFLNLLILLFLDFYSLKSRITS